MYVHTHRQTRTRALTDTQTRTDGSVVRSVPVSTAIKSAVCVGVDVGGAAHGAPRPQPLERHYRDIVWTQTDRETVRRCLRRTWRRSASQWIRRRPPGYLSGRDAPCRSLGRAARCRVFLAAPVDRPSGLWARHGDLGGRCVARCQCHPCHVSRVAPVLIGVTNASEHCVLPHKLPYLQTRGRAHRRVSELT